MQRPSSLGESQNQAAWPILVVRIVLYNLTAIRYRFLQLPDSDIAEQALIDGMLGELILTPLYLASDFRKHVHATILLCSPLLVNPPSLQAEDGRPEAVGFRLGVFADLRPLLLPTTDY
jgi:hypothetical protein